MKKTTTTSPCTSPVARTAAERDELLKQYACTAEDGSPGARFGAQCVPLQEAMETFFESTDDVADLCPLRLLTGVDRLSLGGALVSSLPPLVDLKAMTMLAIFGTGESDLSPLKGLKNIQYFQLPDGTSFPNKAAITHWRNKL